MQILTKYNCNIFSHIPPNPPSTAMLHFTVMDHDYLRSNDFAGEAFLELNDVIFFNQHFTNLAFSIFPNFGSFRQSAVLAVAEYENFRQNGNSGTCHNCRNNRSFSAIFKPNCNIFRKLKKFTLFISIFGQQFSEKKAFFQGLNHVDLEKRKFFIKMHAQALKLTRSIKCLFLAIPISGICRFSKWPAIGNSDNCRFCEISAIGNFDNCRNCKNDNQQTIFILQVPGFGATGGSTLRQFNLILIQPVSNSKKLKQISIIFTISIFQQKMCWMC